MRSFRRRIRANFLYLRRPCIEFVPLLLGLVVLVFLGGLSFSELYVIHEEGGRHPAYFEGVYLTYCLIFMEHLYGWPDHWLLQVFYVVLPPIGLAVVLDAIVRFSYHILRRDETSREWNLALAKTMNNHVIQFGLGKLGLRVLQELLRLGELVVVVEKDPQCPNIAYARKHGVPVRIGMGREDGILEDLNIARAKSLILATDDDLMNLEVAIDARKLRPEIRVVLRMFDQELAQKIQESFDIKLAFSTWELSAPLFATASSDRSILNAFYVADKLMAVAKIRIAPNSTLAGKRVMDLRSEHRALVLDVLRNGEEVFIPDSDYRLTFGDDVTLQCLVGELSEIHDENGERVLFDEPIKELPEGRSETV